MISTSQYGWTKHNQLKTCLSPSPVHPQTQVSKPVSTVQSTQERHCLEKARELKASVKPLLFTELAVRIIGKDSPKTDHGGVSRRETLKEEGESATSKPWRTISAKQN